MLPLFLLDPSKWLPAKVTTGLLTARKVTDFYATLYLEFIFSVVFFAHYGGGDILISIFFFFLCQRVGITYAFYP